MGRPAIGHASRMRAGRPTTGEPARGPGWAHQGPPPQQVGAGGRRDPYAERV